ncbi:hypothetical protein NN3_56220 [Nocardia neocaledoniensis NBRC 108232]|uniref:Membrane protein (TIGR02234 family) n=1 Tax=Nocardia neocaledoniensis TaxID=236511 RepID=A0A317NF01_9NOCA|nr:DUF6223 family protein [Nocardia neocaledoniensis]PWV73503.1 hypothetical protein DFR69_107130 [Nocardia neocaledoniensis]GEM34615.1 hypothetical protein NN3_56220 [Nocardia neocaledoniensis NBRC 108232]
MFVRPLAIVAMAGLATTASTSTALSRPTTATTSFAADVYDLSVGRLGSSSAALVGIAGVILGGLALARSGSATRSTIALFAGLLALAVGTVVAVTADGGLGTGNGLGGAFVAILVGAIATVLGALALRRARRAG